MNPIKWFKSLFDQVDVGVPMSNQALSPEPSCFAKGVAELWKRGEGWKVTYDKKAGIGRLRHKETGTVITTSETELGCVISIEVTVDGQLKIYQACSNWKIPSIQDHDLISQTIQDNPYSNLAYRRDRAVKIIERRQSRVKQIEALGCPTVPDESMRAIEEY